MSHMKRTFYAGVAVTALLSGAAQAQDLMFPIGEGDFNWDSLQTYADEFDLSGQTLTITGPWTGQDAELVNSVIDYFENATGATVDATAAFAARQGFRRTPASMVAPPTINSAGSSQPGRLRLGSFTTTVITAIAILPAIAALVRCGLRGYS